MEWPTLRRQASDRWLGGGVGPSPELVGALGWYVRDVLRLDRVFNCVTVKRRRNLARPVRRRRSAFRDPMICIDFLAMAWLGATRLSQIARYLRPRDDLARAFGLPRFCDHTTAHNFLNAFHRTHLRQLDDANARLLAEHGVAATARAPVLDLDVASRTVRRGGRRRDVVYRWALALCGGEGVAQALDHRAADWRPVLLDTLEEARRRVGGKPSLVRLAGTGASMDLLRALDRRRVPFLATVSWPWALAQHPAPEGAVRWTWLDAERRALDLGAAPAASAPGLALRTVLVERPAPAPGLRRERVALVSSLLEEDPPAIVRLGASTATLRHFFGHRRWPLGDGKMPSGDPRGNGAYLRLATIAMNVLRLFARALGEEWTLPRLRAQLRLVPSAGARGGRPSVRAGRRAAP